MLEQLELENFRNFNRGKWSLGRRVTVVGPNGSGKTSFLEAIRVLSVGKSFRSAREADLIRFNEQFFRLKGQINTVRGTKKVEYFHGAAHSLASFAQSQLLYEGRRTSYLKYIGTFPTTVFLPSDLDLVLGSPENRRRWLDGVMFQLERGFRLGHLELNKVLRERSAVLHLIKTNQADMAELAPWNELLINLSAQIRQKRRQLVEFIQSWIKRINLKGVSGELELSYQEQASDIERVIPQEIRLAQNLFGPHRDELVIKFGGKSSRRFASRGQARLITAALKAAEAAFLAEKLAPVTVLLDDPFSELDSRSVKAAMELFTQSNQLILTAISAGLDGFEKIELAKDA